MFTLADGDVTALQPPPPHFVRSAHPTSETFVGCSEGKRKRCKIGGFAGRGEVYPHCPAVPNVPTLTTGVYIHRLLSFAHRNHNAPFPARAHLHPDATRLVVRAQDFVPRMGYLPAMIAKVMESFRSAVVDGWEEQDVWFDHCGHPLKWYGV